MKNAHVAGRELARLKKNMQKLDFFKSLFVSSTFQLALAYFHTAWACDLVCYMKRYFLFVGAVKI